MFVPLRVVSLEQTCVHVGKHGAESCHCSTVFSHKNMRDSSSSPSCTQCSDRSLPPSPGVRRHFFCTSCSSFRAAMFFGSTLSRLFRSSTQALTSCRNDNDLSRKRKASSKFTSRFCLHTFLPCVRFP